MPRVLNLYAGIGGNRALWPADAQVTAVENDPQIAEAYRSLWPQDELVIDDAHQYLLDHLTDGWDFIWSSPPCQTHSKLNAFMAKRGRIQYPDLDHLYGEIILLTHRTPEETKWLVENVNPYYQPLIPPTSALGRHYVWAGGFVPPMIRSEARPRIAAETSKHTGKAWEHSLMMTDGVGDFEEYLGIRLPPCAATWGRYKRRQVLRNCVHPAEGLAVYNAAFGVANPVQGTLLEVEA